MAADQGIRLTTAGAVAGVAAVASYEHAYALVRARGEAARAGRLVPLDAVRRRCVHRRAGGAGPGSAGGSFEPGLNVVQIALEHRLLTAAQQWPGQSEQAMRLHLHPHDQVGTSRRARPLIVLPCRLDAGLLKPLSLRYPAVVGAEGPAQASQSPAQSRPTGGSSGGADGTPGHVQLPKQERELRHRPLGWPATRIRSLPVSAPWWSSSWSCICQNLPWPAAASAGPFGFAGRVHARHQPLAGEVRGGDLGQVLGIEHGQLQVAAADQLLDLRGAQRGDPVQLSGATSSRSRAAVSMPRSPTSTTRPIPNRSLTLATWAATHTDGTAGRFSARAVRISLRCRVTCRAETGRNGRD